MKQPTQNEPQLSAEIIRDIENHNPDGSRAWTIRQEQVNKNVQHFLATALEEQRAEIAAKLTHQLVREDGDFTDGEIEDWETVTVKEVHTAIQSLLKGEA